MFAEPQTITLTVTELFSVLRDSAFLISLAVGGWKLRSWVQPGIDYFKRSIHHMDVMESGMTKLLDNHLPHIEEALKSQGEIISTDIPPGV